MNDLNRAFPQMTDQEYHALMDAARSVKEEVQPMKRKFSKAILIFAILTLLTASVAVAETLGMFDFLDRWMGTKVLPGATTATNLATLENDYAVYTIEEAAYDGRGMSVMVRITPKDDKTFLLAEGGYYLDDKIAWVLNDESYGEMTIAEYIQQNGYERSVMTRVGFGTTSNWIEEYEDHALTLVYRFPAEGDSITVPYKCFAWCIEENRQSVVPGELTMTAEKPIWTAEITEGADIPNSGLRIDGATLTGTSLGMHIDLRLTVTDADLVKKHNTGIHPVDKDGTPLRPGASHERQNGLSPEEKGASYTRSFCVVPSETAPDALHLSIYQYDLQQETLVTLPVNPT